MIEKPRVYRWEADYITLTNRKIKHQIKQFEPDKKFSI
jgi:uncharacterized lipoprotein YddW (UPF0748 family)